MDISLKLVPVMSNGYSCDQTYLHMPTSFTYEDKDGVFVHNVSGGLPIVGKPHPETKVISYFIGESGSIDQLTSFISSLSKNMQCSITFSENEDFVNMIEYDPLTSIWKHITGSKMGNYGSTINMKISDETVRLFRLAFEGFRRFAYMQIEGHRRLCEDNDI